jgi:hypothetical protein
MVDKFVDQDDKKNILAYKGSFERSLLRSNLKKTFVIQHRLIRFGSNQKSYEFFLQTKLALKTNEY